jgi:hypothetical protein
MKNTRVGSREAADIQRQVAKLLRGLDNPEPPLNLSDLRELRRLDVRYYSSSNDSFLHEVVSRVRVAGRQIARRPSLLRDVVRKAKLSALWLPDRQRILIDADVHRLKHRWLEAHEHGHGVIPWHGRFLFGDDSETLDPACHHLLEAEANYAAGQILFLQGRFTTEAADLPVTIDSLQILQKAFGNTLTSTLWRFVEEVHAEVPIVGIVSVHPHRPGPEFDPQDPCKHVIESPAFSARFGSTTESALFAAIRSYCSPARGGPLGSSGLQLTDRDGKRHEFVFESFSIGYSVLTLGVHVRSLEPIVSVL